MTGHEPDRKGTEAAERADSEGDLNELDHLLECHSYPTTRELGEAFGDNEVETQDGWSLVGELLTLR